MCKTNKWCGCNSDGPNESDIEKGNYCEKSTKEDTSGLVIGYVEKLTKIAEHHESESCETMSGLKGLNKVLKENLGTTSEEIESCIDHWKEQISEEHKEYARTLRLLIKEIST